MKHQSVHSPLHRPRACTVSTLGPCHCRAAGNCWPSPSCHNVPVWPQRSPPSAPRGPPGARAPDRSPPETSRRHLRQSRKIQADGITHRFCRWTVDCCGLCSVATGLRLQNFINSWCLYRGCLWIKCFEVTLHSSSHSGGPWFLQNSSFILRLEGLCLQASFPQHKLKQQTGPFLFPLYVIYKNTC